MGWLICGLNGVRMAVHVLCFVNEHAYKIGPVRGGGGPVVDAFLVFLGSPWQTKGFRFCFGIVLALFWSLWGTPRAPKMELKGPPKVPKSRPRTPKMEPLRLLGAVGGSLLTPVATR